MFYFIYKCDNTAFLQFLVILNFTMVCGQPSSVQTLPTFPSASSASGSSKCLSSNAFIRSSPSSQCAHLPWSLPCLCFYFASCCLFISSLIILRHSIFQRNFMNSRLYCLLCRRVHSSLMVRENKCLLRSRLFFSFTLPILMNPALCVSTVCFADGSLR